MECIAEIDLLSSFGDRLLNSLFFMNLNNQLYIAAPFTFDNFFEKIILYDLKGIKVKEINIKNKKKNTEVFDSNCYYEKKTKKIIFFLVDLDFSNLMMLIKMIKLIYLIK